MPTFIKTGYWEKIQKGYKGWLNLDDLIGSSIGTGTTNFIPKYVGPNTLGDSNISATSSLIISTFTSSTSYVGQSGNTRFGFAGNTATLIFTQGLPFAIGTFSNHPLVFGTNNTENVRIFLDGNVGIGTGDSNAAFKLDVNGTARVQGLFSSYGADFFVAQSAGAGADYFHVDDDPNLSAGANSQTIALMRLRDRGGNGVFTGVNRLGIIMENSAGGNYPFQLFSETGNIRMGYSTVAASTSKLSIRGGSNDNTQLTIIATASNDTATLRAYNSNQVIVGAGGTLSASAALQVESTTRGFLPPRVTTVEKTAITTPTAGLVVYDTTLNKLCVYTGAAWQTVSSA